MLKKLALAVSLVASFQVAQATTNIYPLNGHQVLGEEQVYSINDTGTTTLEYVAAEYHLGLSNMIEANPEVDPIVPAKGSKLIILLLFVCKFFNLISIALHIGQLV